MNEEMIVITLKEYQCESTVKGFHFIMKFGVG